MRSLLQSMQDNCRLPRLQHVLHVQDARLGYALCDSSIDYAQEAASLAGRLCAFPPIPHACDESLATRRKDGLVPRRCHASTSESQIMPRHPFVTSPSPRATAAASFGLQTVLPYQPPIDSTLAFTISCHTTTQHCPIAVAGIPSQRARSRDSDRTRWTWPRHSCERHWLSR